jgi:hypothetical protein
LLHRIGCIESELDKTDIDRPPYLAFPTLPEPRALARTGASIIATRTTFLPRHIIDVWSIEPAAKPLQFKNERGALRSDAAGARLSDPALLVIVIRPYSVVTLHD